METIYIAACLKSEPFGLPLIDELKSKLTAFYGYDPFKEIEDTKTNIWCRDFMPVKSADNKLVQFCYKPIYLTETIKSNITIPKVDQILNRLKIEVNHKSDLKLDGGAIEIFGDKAIVSDRVLRENNDRSISSVLSEIKDKLSLKKLVVVPQYPDDYTGHVDGIIRFIDENTVLINEEMPDLNITDEPNWYKRKMHNNWFYSFAMALENHGLKAIPMPMTEYIDNDKQTQFGLYINFLKLKDVIVMPAYETAKDDDAALILEKAYRRPVIRINSKELAKRGGIINCVTWGR
jgi:agmatine deiminase